MTKAPLAVPSRVALSTGLRVRASRARACPRARITINFINFVRKGPDFLNGAAVGGPVEPVDATNR